MPKRLRTILVFFLLGAILNIAVAWGSALWVDGFSQEFFDSADLGATDPLDRGWEIQVVRGRTSTVVNAFPSLFRRPRPPAPDAPAEETDAWMRERLAYDAGKPLPPRLNVTLVRAPRWSRAARPTDSGVQRGDGIREDARGWPLRSLVGRIDDTAGVAPSSTFSWRLALDGVQGRLGLSRGLPLRPLPLGFAVNTAMFAAALWLMFTAPLWLRRLLRKRRGRCTICGYDLRGANHLQCPECGVRLASGEDA